MVLSAIEIKQSRETGNAGKYTATYVGKLRKAP